MIQGKFVGVDVSGNSIEVAVRPSGELWTAEAGEDGVAQIADRLLFLRPDLVVLEAYGRFELAVAGTLATVGLPFALIPPRNIRDFARAIGRITRGDHHQAGLLAQFAELVHPDPHPLPAEVVQQLHDLRTRRRELTDLLSTERSRLKSASPPVHRDLQNHIQYLERALKLNSENFNRAIRIGKVSW